MPFFLSFRFSFPSLCVAFGTFALLGNAAPLLADNENLLLGNPSAAGVTEPNNFLIERAAYSLGYDQSSGGPRWVSWHLAQSDRGRSGRSENFAPDPLLPETARIRPSDYRGSRYDRGHICPSGDRTADKETNAQTFLMSNILPQTADLNRQLWRKFEEYCRDQLRGGQNELYIVAGGVGTVKRIADGKVNVPAFCWKVAVILPTGEDDLKRIDAQTRVVAVLMPNDTGPQITQGRWNTYLTSVDKIEELTKLDLFSSLPLDVQQVVEARVDTGRAPDSKTPSRNGAGQNADAPKPDGEQGGE